MDEGKLPLSFWKKRKTENEELKKSRLEEAVAACKGGKMSQAAASMTYHIPKTTIWRRLQQDGKKSERLTTSRKQRLIDSKHIIDLKTQEGSDFTYCEVLNNFDIYHCFLSNIILNSIIINKFQLQVSSEIPITYIDENSIPEDSVIILTAEDMDGLNLEEGRQIIVNSVCIFICLSLDLSRFKYIYFLYFFFLPGLGTRICSLYNKHRRKFKLFTN